MAELPVIAFFVNVSGRLYQVFVCVSKWLNAVRSMITFKVCCILI